MSTNPYVNFIENSTEQAQKILQSLLDQQLQYQQWTESLLEEQARQWASLNEKIQSHQKSMIEQFEQLYKESNPTNLTDGFNQLFKQVQDQLTSFQSTWQNTTNPYQNFYTSMQSFLKQQQQTLQQLWTQPSNSYANQWNNYFQEFQKQQEDWLKQFRNLPFNKL